MTSIVIGMNIFGAIWLILSIIMIVINVIKATVGVYEDKDSEGLTVALNLVLIAGWLVWGFAAMLVMGYK